MSFADELNQARRKLFESLGETTKQYCQLMKLWFSMRITKEEFDLEARKIMTPDQTHLHNEFLLSLFTKCKGLALNSNKSRFKDSRKLKINKQKRNNDKGTFQHLQDEPQRSCMQELFLPDHSLILGRLMLTSWEMGMEGAEDSAAELLVHAVQHFLKNILTAVLSQRNGYRLRERKMIYSLGAPVPNPWLRNCQGLIDDKSDSKITDIVEGDDDSIHIPKIPLTQEELERREMYRLACSNTMMQPPAKPPVSTYDVFKALQVHKSAIPSQSLYAINMDKMISTLNHPSHEELETVRYLKDSKFLGKEDGMRFASKSTA